MVLALLVCLPAVSFSQGMSLTEALSAARAGSHALSAASAEVGAAQGAVTAARADFLPTLSLVGSASQFDGDVYVNRFLGPPQEMAPPPAENGPYDSTASGILRLSQVIYAGGGIKAGVDAERVEARMAETDHQARGLQLDYDVTKAFFDVLLATRSIDVASASIERSERMLEEVQARLREDEALQVDVLGAEARLAVDRQRLIESRNQLALAKRAFNHHLGRGATEPVELDGDLTESLLEVDAAAATRSALANSPSLAKAELAVELTDAMLDGARSHIRPKLEFQTFVSYLDNDMLFEGTYYGGSLNFSIPFARGARAGRGAASEARAKRSVQESQLAELRSAVSLEIEKALLTAEETVASVSVAESSLAYYAERYRVAQVAYREQLATFSDLLDDHAALREAELQLAGAQHRARLAEAEIRRLTSDA